MENLRILFLEDLPSDFNLAKRELEQNGFNFEWFRTDNREGFLRAIDEFKPNLIISDYMMPQFTGMEALNIAAKLPVKIPFIILTGSINEETAVKCLKNGADDYVIKEFIGKLPFAVKEVLRQKELFEQKQQMEQNLLQSEENFRQSLASSPLGIRIVDIQGQTVYANQAFLDIFDIKTLGEFTSVPSVNRYTPDSYIEHLKRKEIRSSGKEVPEYEVSIKRNNGEIRHIKILRKEVFWNREKHYQVINQDITLQKNAEEQVRKISQAVEQNPDAIIITDINGNIEYINPQTTFLSGYSKEELLGQNPKIFSSGLKPKHEYQILWETISSGRVWKGEFYNKRKNGEMYWENAVISPIFSSSGQITNFVAIKEDITEKKQLLADLIKSKEKAEESDRLKSAFLANMSHEIRTPMNGILGFSELLKEPGLSGEEQQKYIGIIEKAGARMLNIIGDIISISTIESGLAAANFSETNVNEQIDYIFNFFKPEVEEKGIRFSCKTGLSGEDAVIKTDREKVFAILTNLVKNAVKYTESGFIELGYEKKGDYLRFYVKDSGIGIPQNRHEAIFERFIQADIEDKMARQGAGLGLSISKAYVEMLGGKIWVESVEGKGSDFWFTLPCSVENEPDPGTTESGTAEKNKNTPASLKILIAEDDESSAFFLASLLKASGHNVLHAETGIEAVSTFNSNPDIDLILMDIKMPGMDGYEATRQIKKMNESVIIIAQTAFALAGDDEKALAAGCNDYITKPINKNKLIELIQKYFKN